MIAWKRQKLRLTQGFTTVYYLNTSKVQHYYANIGKAFECFEELFEELKTWKIQFSNGKIGWSLWKIF